MNSSFVHIKDLQPGDRFEFPFCQSLKYLQYHPRAPVTGLVFEVRFICALTLICCLAIGVDGRWTMRHLIVGIDDLYVSIIASARDSHT